MPLARLAVPSAQGERDPKSRHERNLRLAWRVVRWWPPAQRLEVFTELYHRCAPGLSLQASVTGAWIDKLAHLVDLEQPDSLEALLQARPELLNRVRGYR